jgi:hypothetical protein
MSSIFLDRSVSKDKKLQTTDSFVTSDPSTSFITSDEPVEKSNKINKKSSIFTERNDGTLVGVQPILDTSVSSEPSVIEEEKSEVDPTGLSARLQRAYKKYTPFGGTAYGDDMPEADSYIGGILNPFTQVPSGKRKEELITDGEDVKKETDRLIKLGIPKEKAEATAEAKAMGVARNKIETERAKEAGYTSREEYIEKEIVPLMLEEFEGIKEGSVREDIGVEGKQNNPIMAAMFKAAPVASYNALMSVSDLMSKGTANIEDAIEKQVNDLPKSVFNAVNTVVNLGPKRDAKSSKELTSDIVNALGSTMEFSETLPFVGVTGVATNASIRAYNKAAKNVIAWESGGREKAIRKNTGGAELATMEAAETARLLADAKAKSAAGKQVTEEMIDAFEAKINNGRPDNAQIVIHKLDKDGKKILDDDAARKAGDILAEETYIAQTGTVRDFLTGDLSVGAGEYNFINTGAGEFAHLATGSDTIMKPILNSNKFNAIIAVATDLKARNPKAFAKPRYITKVDKNGQPVLDKNGKPKKIRDPKQISVIDELYTLTVSKDMMAGEELIDMLNDYGLSFEDYVLTVVGSGSEAGKVLQKLSVIKRSRPTTELADAQQKALIDAQGDIRNNFMRLENIRRGLLVSQIATAARNLTSAGIRAPLEGLGNVMDSSLYNLTNKGVGSAAYQIVSPTNWKESFRHMKYMFSEPEVAKGYTDLILGQPQLAKQFDMMYNNLNEIQKATGRGSGGKLDYVLTGLEDATDILNTPNRWQEYLIRRGQFFGELERLTKREYGIDLIDTLQDGKLRDLLNDAGGFKPEGKPSFLELVDQSTKKALDVTYAKQPEMPVFRNITNFITRNGLTVVMPFPRFMFNSMELMGQYAGGAFFPLTRKVTSLVTLGKVGGKPLTPKDRQRISRNLVGMAAVFAAYQYRTSDEAPADYKQIGIGSDTEMDTTPQFPVRQYLYMGEVAKRINEGTFNTFFDAKEFTETFAGTNFRQGSTNSILEEMAAIAAEGSTDLTKGETAGKMLGEAVGNYFATYITPFSQVIEAQRFGLSASGTRGLEYKEMGSDPTLDFTASLLKAGQKPFKKYVTTPQEEAELPPRLTMFGGVKSRVSPLSRVALGINLSTRDKPAGEYLERLGYKDWKLGSTSRVPSIRNAENAHLTEIMPEIVEALKQHEEDTRKIYKKQTKLYRNNITEEEDVTAKVRNLANEHFKAAKSEIRGAGLAGLSPYVRNLIEYRKLSPDFRIEASQRFFSDEKRKGGQRLPDPTNKDDLAELVIIAKVVKDAKKAK